MILLLACAEPAGTDTELGGDREPEVLLPGDYDVDVSWPLEAGR